MKRVIFVSPWLWTAGKFSGMPTVYESMKGFHNRGYEIHLLIGSNEEEKECQYDFFYLHQFKIPKITGVLPFDVNRSIFEAHRNRLLWEKDKRLWIKKASTMFKILLNELNPSIIYCVHPLSCFISREQTHNNVVWRFMGVFLESTDRKSINLKNIIKHPIDYWMFKKLSKISTTLSPIIVITDDGTKGDEVVDAMKINYKSLFFAKNGVEDFRRNITDAKDILSREHLHLYRYISGLRSQGVKVVISTNRFANWKRNDLTVETLEKLVIERGRKDVVFVFLGDGPQFDTIKHRAEISVGNRGIFVGSVDRSTMSLWLGLSDIYISMMDIGQLGNSTFEACLYGLAPVLRNNGETTIFFDKDVAQLVGDTDEAATAIEYLIDKPDTMISLGMAARDLILKKMGTWDERIDNEILWIEKHFFGDV